MTKALDYLFLLSFMAGLNRPFFYQCFNTELIKLGCVELSIFHSNDPLMSYLAIAHAIPMDPKRST